MLQYDMFNYAVSSFVKDTSEQHSSSEQAADIARKNVKMIAKIHAYQPMKMEMLRHLGMMSRKGKQVAVEHNNKRVKHVHWLTLLLLIVNQGRI